MANKICIPLCDWYWLSPVWFNKDEHQIQKLRQLGFTIQKVWNADNFMLMRYVAVFDSEEQAALFKLEHL